MIGIIDVGGGLRDIYGAGVFDRVADDNVTIDYCLGVSAGSANCASFVAKQRGRNLPFYLDYPARREYMSAGNVIKKGSYLDLGYVYGTLSREDGENPVDYETLAKNPTQMVVVATDAETGKARYFDKSDIPRNDYRVFMASSCLPVFCRPIEIDGHYYYDGGLSDPVPVLKAFEDGCDKVILVLSKPIDAQSTGRRDAFGARAIRGKFPNAAASLLSMAEKYRRGVEEAQKRQAEGSVLIIAPDDTGGVKTLTKDPTLLKALYDKGYADAGKIAAFCAKETV